MPNRRMDQLPATTPLPNRAFSLRPGLLGLTLALLSGGCASNMDAIDRHIEKVIGQRASKLGPDSPAPARTYPNSEPSRADRNEQVAKEPATTNPEAKALEFTPADENRDVTARLDRYAEGTAVGAPIPGAKAPLPMNIEDAFRISQRSGRDFLTAEEEYVLAAIRLLQERHLWTPRLSNDTTLGINGAGDAGRFEHTLSLINELKATQRLPWGGSAEAAWVWDATDQLREQATKRYRQSSSLVFSANIPLLRGAGMVAQENLIQSERNLIYQARTFEHFRRQNLVDIATAYFDLLELRAQIANQERQLDGFMRLQESTKARVVAGRLSEFETNNAANQVFRSRAALASLREQYILAEDRFKIRLGLDINQSVDLKPLTFEIPEPEIPIEEATRRALEFRLDLQNTRDQLVDAKRAVANSKNNLLPDLSVGADATIPTSPNTRDAGVGFNQDYTRYGASTKFSLPLDRENEKLSLRAAQIREQQQQRRLDQLRDQIVVSVRRDVRQIDLQRFQLTLAEQQVEINVRRLEEVELKSDTIDPQKIVDAQNDRLSAENQRDAARTNLRTAVLTYLLDTDQLRISRDGTFQKLGAEELSNQPPAPQPVVRPELIPTDPK